MFNVECLMLSVECCMLNLNKQHSADNTQKIKKKSRKWRNLI